MIKPMHVNLGTLEIIVTWPQEHSELEQWSLLQVCVCVIFYITIEYR